jgi:CubicO group peptidase (beta-lactamase class C family)
MERIRQSGRKIHCKSPKKTVGVPYQPVGVNMSNHPNLTWRVLAAFAVMSLGSLPAFAQEKPPADATRPQAGNVADTADLEAFFDGAVNVQLESKHIAGGVVAVVVGDKVAFTKGYGYADVAARRRVDPEKTMFRIGSISKLFTYTAVMQQVEEGKLDIDADVNTYLKDVQIPSTFEQPITLKHLLTHTPGFDDFVIGLFGRAPEDVRPPADVLRAQMPTRVRPPFILASYSNHGTAMAGHAVACVAGQTWEDYVEQRILKPLGMQHTLVRQPAEDKLPADVSKGYRWTGDHFEAKSFEYVPAAPAGCIAMSGADAAKFMLAHLHDGQLGDAHILKPETARRMREPLFRHAEKTSAMCYGFFEHNQHGLRMVGHGGATMWFHSLMFLIPDRGVGVFISFNTNTGATAHVPVFEAFLRRYYPQPDPPRIQPANDFRERAKRLTGEYGVTRYSHTTLAKLAALFAVFDVSMNDDDTLTISIGDNSRRYVEVEPFIFRELDGTQQIVFQEDQNKKVSYLFRADVAAMSAVRRAWYELTWVNWGLLGGSLAIFASAAMFWPVIAFSVRGLSSPKINRTRFSGVLSFLAWLGAAVSLGFGAALAYVLKDPSEIAFGMTPRLNALLAVPQFCAGLAAITVLGCLVAWIKRYWRVTGRLHYTLVALAGIGFTWFLFYWNLLRFGFEGIVS